MKTSEMLREVIAKFARKFDVDTECTCQIHRQTAPITETGHKVGCKVEEAVMRYLDRTK